MEKCLNNKSVKRLLQSKVNGNLHHQTLPSMLGYQWTRARLIMAQPTQWISQRNPLDIRRKMKLIQQVQRPKSWIDIFAWNKMDGIKQQLSKGVFWYPPL